MTLAVYDDDSKQGKQEALRRWNTRIAAPVGDAEVERVKPHAPHWDGISKYGPMISFEGGSLYIYAAGHGSKDGDGYFVFSPDEADWERDDETGKDYCVVKSNNSELIFLRDQLNQWFPAALTGSSEDTQAPDVEMVARAICEARCVGHQKPDDMMGLLHTGPNGPEPTRPYRWEMELRPARAAILAVRNSRNGLGDIS
jgi:hypothetical protein